MILLLLYAVPIVYKLILYVFGFVSFSCWVNIGTWHLAVRNLDSLLSFIPAFPFSTELAGFIKRVRNKNKNSLSGLSIDEIVQRVTEHILDEQKKKKVSVSSNHNKMSHFILIYLQNMRIVKQTNKCSQPKCDEQFSKDRSWSSFWVTKLASPCFISVGKSRKGQEAGWAQLPCCFDRGLPGPALHDWWATTQSRGAECGRCPCECYKCDWL